MIQNSLERLLIGLAMALRHDIAPALTDDFARRQALAGTEIVENLVTRVRWREDELAQVVATIRPLLDAADELAPDAPELARVRRIRLLERPAAGARHDPLALRDAHLRALADVQAWLSAAGAEGEELRGRVRAASVALLDAELAHLEAARGLARAGGPGSTRPIGSSGE